MLGVHIKAERISTAKAERTKRSENQAIPKCNF